MELISVDLLSNGDDWWVNYHGFNGYEGTAEWVERAKRVVREIGVSLGIPEGEDRITVNPQWDIRYNGYSVDIDLSEVPNMPNNQFLKRLLEELPARWRHETKTRR